MNKLGNLITYISRGITPKYIDETNAENTNLYCIVLNQKCIRNYEVNILLARKNDLSIKKVSNDRRLRKFDILINSTGTGTLGRVAQYLDDSNLFVTIDAHITVVRPDSLKIDPMFMGYLLKSKQSIIKGMAQGSTGQTELYKDSLINLELNYNEDINYQKRTAEFLRNIDDKIQLNTQTNQTLEQIAQAIYKSWFVDFAPTRAKAAVLAAGGSAAEAQTAAMSALSGHPPAALARQNPVRHQQLATLAAAFPSALVTIDGYGEVPAGWEVKKVGDIAKVIKGKSYKSSELESSKTALVTLKSFNRGGGYRLDGLKEYTGTYKPEQEVFAGDLIIAYTDVTQAADVIGKPAMVMSDNRYEHLIISLDVGVVRPNNSVYKYFLYCMAMTVAFQAHTQSFCTGTTVLHLGKDAVPSFEIAVPNEFLLKKFAEISESIFAKINENIKQSVRLQNFRDTLLPKLLNGELPADTSFQTASEAV